MVASGAWSTALLTRIYFLQIPTACWPAFPSRLRMVDRATLHPGTLRDCSLLFAVLHDALLHGLS